MLRKYLDVEKIIKAYIGDYTWLEEIQEQVNKIETENAKELDTIYDVQELLTLLFKMNYIVIETETQDYASDFYDTAHEVYSQMKIKLTQMLGIDFMWEEL